MDSEALSQFVSVTGATPDAAQFFLESSSGDVAAAIDQYFTSGGQAQQEEQVPAPVAHQQAAAPTAITPQSTAAAATAPSRNKPNTGTSVDQLRSLNLGICQTQFNCVCLILYDGAGKGKRPAGGVRSLADVAKDTDEDTEDDEGNEYYAGGEKRYVRRVLMQMCCCLSPCEQC